MMSVKSKLRAVNFWTVSLSASSPAGTVPLRKVPSSDAVCLLPAVEFAAGAPAAPVPAVAAAPPVNADAAPTPAALTPETYITVLRLFDNICCDSTLVLKSETERQAAKATRRKVFTVDRFRVPIPFGADPVSVAFRQHS